MTDTAVAATTIPAITLIQPWASLIACGAKRFESRSWAAPAALIGRTVAIHAGKNRTEGVDLIEEIADLAMYGETERFGDEYDRAFDALHAIGITGASDYPYGKVVCTARLVACHPAESVAALPDAVFGDFSSGRWAWDFDEVTILSAPVPCRGPQGIWTFDPATGRGAWGWRP